MNDDQQLHPARDTLAAYGLGKLEPAESGVVEAHIAECHDCCETLLDLKGDTFVDLVRRSDAVESNPDTQSSQVTDGTVVFPGAAAQSALDLLPGQLAQASEQPVFDPPQVGRVEQFLGASEGAGEVDQPDLPVIGDQQIALVEVRVEDQFVENPPSIALEHPFLGVRGLDSSFHPPRPPRNSRSITLGAPSAGRAAT